jgi:hypothetical protein
MMPATTARLIQKTPISGSTAVRKLVFFRRIASFSEATHILKPGAGYKGEPAYHNPVQMASAGPVSALHLTRPKSGRETAMTLIKFYLDNDFSYVTMDLEW